MDPVNEAAPEAEKAEKRAYNRKEKMVTVFLPPSSEHHAVQMVMVNDRKFEVRRGEPQQVPMVVAEVLIHAGHLSEQGVM